MAKFTNLAKLINEAANNPDPAKEFLRILNDAIAQDDYKQFRKRPPTQTFKPSMLGGCMRELFFEVRGTKVDDKRKDPNLVGMGESGTDRHSRLQRIVTKLKDLGYANVEWIDVEEYLKFHPVPGTRIVKRNGYEVKLRNDILNMNFQCDGIIKLNGVYYILEIKTETSFKWMPRFQPEEKAVTQAASYGVGIGINRTMFVYENRDTCAKKVYIVEVSEIDKYERVVHRIETVNAHIEANEAPPMSENKKEDCKYCKYTEACTLWGKGARPK